MWKCGPILWPNFTQAAHNRVRCMTFHVSRALEFSQDDDRLLPMEGLRGLAVLLVSVRKVLESFELTGFAAENMVVRLD